MRPPGQSVSMHRKAPGPPTAPEATLSAPLRSITAYHGWLILEYSEGVKGKLKARFAVQHPPDGSIPAGHSFHEAKQAIDGPPQARSEPSGRATGAVGANDQTPSRRRSRARDPKRPTGRPTRPGPETA